MARRRKRIMPEIMREEWFGPRDVAPDMIEAMLEIRWFYQQTASALGFPDHCPRLRCRRRHNCVSYKLAADYCAEPIKLYPACVRNREAIRLIQSSLDTIRQNSGVSGEDDDEVDEAAFAAAGDGFRRARLAAQAAEKAAAEKAKREA